MLLKKTRTRKRNLIVFSRTFIIFVRGYASRTISSFPLSTVSIYSRFLSVSVEYRNLSLDRFERRNKAARNRFSSSVSLEWLKHRARKRNIVFVHDFERILILFIFRGRISKLLNNIGNG